jgi:phosphotransferase family enzyme
VTAVGSTPEAQFVPGSNIRGTVEGANWCFLLPSLELGRVVSVGAPTPSALAALARLSEEIAVWAPARHIRRLRGTIEGHELSKVAWLTAGREGAIPLPDGSADVVLVAGHRHARRLARGGKMQEEVERLLKPGGVVYVESRFAGRRSRPAGAEERQIARLERSTLFWLAPAWGEMRVAAPLADDRAIAYLEKRFLTRRLFRRQLLTRSGRALGRHVLTNRILGRRGALLRGAESALAEGPPGYLRSVAASAGTDIDRDRWCLAAPGDYSSQKVLFFLFDGGGETAKSVVKITRDPRLNSRLENEWRALTLLRERGIAIEGTLPSPIFFGYHAELAILGETAVEGAPFRERTRATADCPHARNVVDWLLEFGVATAHRPDGPPDCAAVLEAHLDRFKDLYRLDSGRHRFLADQVAAIAHGENDLPLVFQHGDPGPWNVIVTQGGQPAFLDWEAADPDGMPLWDLFHFLRSFGLSISQRAGRRDPIQSFAEQVLADSKLNRLLVETARRFCAEAALSPGLVEPLFHLCWMHRALKEATRLPPERLQSGRYVNLLRLSIDRRDSPGLRRLFALSPGS